MSRSGTHNYRHSLKMLALNLPSSSHLYLEVHPIYIYDISFTHMKEESIIANHYASKFNGLTRVEYIGDKPKPACIKQINVGSDVQSVSFPPDEKRVVSGTRRNVCIWDVVDGGLVVDPLGEYSYSVIFTKGGQYIATGNKDGTIGVWNAATGKSIYSALEGRTKKVNSVAFRQIRSI